MTISAGKVRRSSPLLEAMYFGNSVYLQVILGGLRSGIRW